MAPWSSTLSTMVAPSADDTSHGVTWQILDTYTMDADSKVRFMKGPGADSHGMVVDGIRLVFDSLDLDTTPPTVESYNPTPPAGATGVPITQDLQLDFSEPIQKHATGGEKFITLTNLDGRVGRRA